VTRWAACVNDLGHLVQWYDFSPLCTRWWMASRAGVGNGFSHVLQRNGFSGSGPGMYSTSISCILGPLRRPRLAPASSNPVSLKSFADRVLPSCENSDLIISDSIPKFNRSAFEPPLSSPSCRILAGSLFEAWLVEGTTAEEMI